MTSNGKLYARRRNRSTRGSRRACTGVLPDTISVRIGAEKTSVRNAFVRGSISELAILLWASEEANRVQVRFTLLPNRYRAPDGTFRVPCVSSQTPRRLYRRIAAY